MKKLIIIILILILVIGAITYIALNKDSNDNNSSGKRDNVEIKSEQATTQDLSNKIELAIKDKLSKTD